MQTQARFHRSFTDALTLGRNQRDDFTIYYHDPTTGKRAMYEITGKNEGAPYIDGRMLTAADLPPEMRTELNASDQAQILTRFAPVAMKIFEHNGIALDTGWDIRPVMGA